MPTNQQAVKIKCPHCGWVRTMTINLEEGQADVVAGIGDIRRGVSEALQKTVEKFKQMLNNPELAEANSWLPMPACPNCQKVFEYNIHDKRTR